MAKVKREVAPTGAMVALGVGGLQGTEKVLLTPTLAATEPARVLEARVEAPKCPFTGRPLELVYNDRLKQWLARSSFYSTRLFGSKADLLAVLAQRAR